MSVAQPALKRQIEDPLAHLPFSNIVEYRKGRVIYLQESPSVNLYLVIEGKVKVSQVCEDGRQVVVDVYQSDDFFGESALLGLPRRAEQAVALEDTRLMMWPGATIEDMVSRRPRLAVALLQTLVQRSIGFKSRIQTLSTNTTPHRLARSLVRLAERMGTRAEDGSLRMGPLTHELLAQYVGTTREIITQHMTQFRRLGYLLYDRQGIILYREALLEWVRRTA